MINLGSAQLLVDELVVEIDRAISDDTASAWCAWWRGRASGAADTLKAFTEDGEIDFRQLDLAVSRLHEADDYGAGGGQ